MSEEEQIYNTEEEIIYNSEEEQITKTEEEILYNAEEEQMIKTEEEILYNTEEEQKLKTEEEIFKPEEEIENRFNNEILHKTINIQTDVIKENKNKFNDNYDYTNDLNKSIMTKNRLISNTINANKKSNMMIEILSSTVMLILLSIIIGVLIYFHVLTPKAGQYIVLVFVVVYIYKVFISQKFKYKDFSKISEDTSKELDKKLNKYKDSQIINKSNEPNNTCPNYCTTKKDEKEEDVDLSYLIPYKKYMNTDSTRNVWKDGSTYDNLYTSENEPDIYQSPKNLPIYRNKSNNENIEPKQWVQGDNENTKSGIFYDCKWTGNPGKHYAPYEKEYNNSRIPCQYYQDFETINTKICDLNNGEPVNCRMI